MQCGWHEILDKTWCGNSCSDVAQGAYCVRYYFIPREELLDDWKNDYAEMRTHFIYGESLPFNELLKRMYELQDRFRSIK